MKFWEVLIWRKRKGKINHINHSNNSNKSSTYNIEDLSEDDLE